MRSRTAILGGGLLVSVAPALRTAPSAPLLSLMLVVFGALAVAALTGTARRSAPLAGCSAVASLAIAVVAPPEARSSLVVVVLGAVAASSASVPEPILPGLPARRAPVARTGLGLVLLAQLWWWRGSAFATVATLTAALAAVEWYRWWPDAADRKEHRISQVTGAITGIWRARWRWHWRWRRPGVATTPVHRLRELDRCQRAFALVVIASIVVTAIALLHTLQVDGWTQVGDEANQIYGAQRVPRDWPLLGDLNTANLYGNEFSHHPGPMAWYVLAPWVLVIGPQTGAWLFALVWNLVSIVTAAWLAHRSGGFRPAAVVLVGATTAFALGAPQQFASTFFQVLPLLPLLVSLVASWALARGDTIAFPIVAVAATFVVQSATLNLPLVLLCGAVATISAARHLRAGTAVDGRVRWHLGLGMGALVVLWSPTVWDQVFETGNLSKLLEADIPHDGISGAFDLVRHARSAIDPLPDTMVTVGVAAVVLALVVALSTRRRAWRAGGDRALVLVVAAAVIGSAITAALLPTNDVEATHRMWVPIVAAFLTMAALTAALGDGSVPPLTRIAGVICTLLALAFALPNLREPQQTELNRVSMAAVHAILPDVLDAAAPGELGLTFRGGFSAGTIAQGLLPPLADHQRFGDLSYDIVARDGPTLVVIRNERTSWQKGRVVASYEPPADPRVPSDFVEQLARSARERGPIALAPSARFLLANLIDGQLASACIDDLLRTPDLVLDLPPQVFASVYAAGLVTSPEITPHLAEIWQATQPVLVLQPTATESRSGEMIFTRSSC